MELLGREKERKILDHCLKSTESKLVAIYGRRRIGKTFLVRKHFDQKLRFEVTGLHKGSLKDQLDHFSNTLVKAGYYPLKLGSIASWMAAFESLGYFIDQLNDHKKKVIFIDELPWFDTPRSKFLMAFESFWNSYCTKREDILLIICGSAASWMIKKILKNKGGLHNRISEKIDLKPFSLRETEKFLRFKGILWSKYDITQLYLVTGGIPFYLDAIRKGESVAMFVDRVCFKSSGILFDEYHQLYASLFNQSEDHQKIVKALANKKQGLTRSEIIEKTSLPTGGTLSNTLDELEQSGFIELINPYTSNKSKCLYKLIDNFTLFYFQFMISGSKRITDSWTKTVNTQNWISWAGLAFERICFSHRDQIVHSLGLRAIQVSISTWKTTSSQAGAQIDMLIDRADRIINVCEIKFYKSDFTINKEYAKNLRNKLTRFSELAENKRKTLFLTMITTFGTVDNEYYKELVQNEITLEDLFILESL